MVKSDVVVPARLAEALQDAVRPLENVPEQQKLWHPESGSGNNVLDLLDPCLFPLTHGLSRALPSGTVPLEDCSRFIGEGELVLQLDIRRRLFRKPISPDMTFSEPGRASNGFRPTFPSRKIDRLASPATSTISTRKCTGIYTTFLNNLWDFQSHFGMSAYHGFSNDCESSQLPDRSMTLPCRQV